MTAGSARAPGTTVWRQQTNKRPKICARGLVVLLDLALKNKKKNENKKKMLQAVIPIKEKVKPL